MEFWFDVVMLAAEGPPPTEHAPLNVYTTLPTVVVVAIAGRWAIRRFKLPFVGRVFWWALPAVYVAAALAWTGLLMFSEYKLMPADYGGTIISGAILSYLIHLWLIPIDELPHGAGEPSGDNDLARSDAEKPSAE